MGNCSSCLGSRRHDDYDEDDEAQHLFEDSSNMHYGSFGQQHMMGQEDPQEAQREIEALQRVVARTSNNMVDIYEIVPHDKAAQPVSVPYVYAGQDANMVQYQTLLSKLSSQDDLAAVARVDWGTPEDDTIEMQQGVVPIKVDGGEALVGNFADAAAAMR
ncbi:late endosomal/lysosomal adaptor and MAPK and MTOR activator-domain-containing protein [Achaetomium macrosporum]|uniref:Late endosomal/lysosomal adaptor and MAPK and MTOR activator-domain-containing protein n=1 Tax=Achaetomium macrosporum TaxID=79813 RepID=A0AAN7C9X7_9PEZI|nr:late endosomal/lysosomal adaptor and MAPK and MTOR activator-domain-containing protein [Achaetomium macrosporum]